MGITKESFDDILHRMKIRLFPNYLPNSGGAYVARTENEASLDIEQICTVMVNRGGFDGSFSDLVGNVKRFFREVSYQICDGFSANLGFFSVHPVVGGTFDSQNDPRDSAKNPISFRYRTRAPLKELIKHIAVDIAGVSDGGTGIYGFYDYEEEGANIFTPGNMFAVTGSKIKIAGDDPGVGIFIVPVDDPCKARAIALYAATRALPGRHSLLTL